MSCLTSMLLDEDGLKDAQNYQKKEKKKQKEMVLDERSEYQQESIREG